MQATHLRITYLYHLHGFASPEPQKNPLEMCVPVSKTKIALEWWKFASVRCTTLWFVHTRSSCQTIQPRFSLGPEKERDGQVSCRSLRKNPGNRTKNGLVLPRSTWTEFYKVSYTYMKANWEKKSSQYFFQWTSHNTCFVVLYLDERIFINYKSPLC